MVDSGNVRRTWDGRHAFNEIYLASVGDPAAPEWAVKGLGPIPIGIGQLSCGCFVDTFASSEIWEPCRAHESDGHLCSIREQDGLYVARCLVLRCGVAVTEFYLSEAFGAAQRHWRNTRTQPAPDPAGST